MLTVLAWDGYELGVGHVNDVHSSWDHQWQEQERGRRVYLSFSSAEVSHYCWHTH
jgi:hypothetical protein